MPTEFIIDFENHITAGEAGIATDPAAAIFTTQLGLRELVRHWPLQRLVAVWNQIPGLVPVRKFENRTVAVRRIWQALQPSTTGTPIPRRLSRPSYSPRPGTRAASLLALLQRPEGASLDQLMSVSGWQRHSVRGFLSGNLRTQRGFKIRSFKRDGQRIYRVQS
jgi:hypothetical protein